MQNVIIVIHLMIVLAMVGLILLQKSEGGGLGMGGGAGFMSNRGAGNVLSRTTAILAGVFFATSLILSVMASMERRPRSMLDGGGQPASSVPGAPTSPSSPLAPGGGGVLDQLRGGEQPPSGPAVPRSQ